MKRPKNNTGIKKMAAAASFFLVTREKRGLSSLEYAVLILTLVLALLSVQVILKRAISGKWKTAVDGTFGPGQYESGTATTTTLTSH